MAYLSCRHIYNQKQHIYDFNLEVKDGDFVILFGNKTCGNSSILRMMAGLNPISSGQFLMNHKVMNRIHPQKREIGMVFSDYMLHSNMTIYDNIILGLKQHKIPKEQIPYSIKNIAKILELSHLLECKPTDLNKSQKLCVAIARAVIQNPKALLLDHPLTGFEEAMRIPLRTKISRLHQKFGLTIIYATDNLGDAMALGTKIIAMNTGSIEQIGFPKSNFLEAICMIRETAVSLKIDNSEIPLPPAKAAPLLAGNYNAKYIIAGIRPEDITILTELPITKNGFLEGTIIDKTASKSDLCFTVKTMMNELIVQSQLMNQTSVGEDVYLLPDVSKMILFDMDSGNRIM
jgi:multiple sugar transport system ATP-binding protein